MHGTLILYAEVRSEKFRKKISLKVLPMFPDISLTHKSKCVYSRKEGKRNKGHRIKRLNFDLFLKK